MTQEEIETGLDKTLPKPVDCDVFYETMRQGDVGGYIAITLEFEQGADKKGIEEYASRLAAIFKQALK